MPSDATPEDTVTEAQRAAVTDTTPEELDSALDEAQQAFTALRSTTGAQRAELLRAIAAGLDGARDDLAAIADTETGLGLPRLLGEIRQTRVDLGILADWIEAGRHLNLQRDEPDVANPLSARPEMVKFAVPVGVVLNFAASNFPFAFSVAGVDTAAALAAGCSVVVKAHPGHPLTSAATASIIDAAVSAAGLPVGTVRVVFGDAAGTSALADRRVRAASFTGSVSGGRFLASVAAARPDPIPFYGELGSINPVVVTPGALDDRGPDLAREYVGIVSESAGQACTKPGLLFAPAGHALASVIADAASSVPEHRMLYPGLGEGYARRRQEVLAVPGVRAVVPGATRVDENGNTWVTPSVYAVSLPTLEEHRDVLAEEAFGPLSIVVEYDDVADALHALPRVVQGSLTLSVHLAESEQGDLADAVVGLQGMAGRVIVNEWPAAVHITATQHHGGPFPSTTLDVPAATSVGPSSLGRFQRSVSWQNPPRALLPVEVRTLLDAADHPESA
jgi:NADP-dependent aldehyde dehydrogenase